MPTPLALAAFWGGLALMLAGARLLPRGLDRLVRRLRSRPGHVGLLTALGANSPEIAAAVAALVSGSYEAGYGIVLGSNLFNLAALLGVAALVAGRVDLRAAAVGLHGAVGLAVTLVAVVLVLGLVGPWVAAILVAAIFVPYVLLLGASPARVERLPLPSDLSEALRESGGAEREREEELEEEAGPPFRRGGFPALLLASLGAIVVGSVGLLRGALVLGGRLGIPEILVGALVLAFLSGLPNLYTSVRLARAGRGRAVVSEALNSNTLNVIVGISLPALVFGISDVGGGIRLEAWWLFGLSALAIGLTARGGGLRRPGGALIVLLYLAFVAVRVAIT